MGNDGGPGPQPAPFSAATLVGSGGRGRVASPACEGGNQGWGTGQAKSVQFLVCVVWSGLVRPLAPTAIALQKTVETLSGCRCLAVSFSRAASCRPAMPCHASNVEHTAHLKGMDRREKGEIKKKGAYCVQETNNKQLEADSSHGPSRRGERPISHLHAAWAAAKQAALSPNAACRFLCSVSGGGHSRPDTAQDKGPVCNEGKDPNLLCTYMTDVMWEIYAAALRADAIRITVCAVVR